MYSGYDSADLFAFGQKSAVTKSTVISLHSTGICIGSDWFWLAHFIVCDLWLDEVSVALQWAFYREK